MPDSIQIGSAHSASGQITYGTFDAVRLPTGEMDSFPVMIAQGEKPGPVLWLTANIHGSEYDGLAVIHQLLSPELVTQLAGTVVAIPTLSPAGLRTGERSPYYLRGKDPNRLFPGLDGSESTNSNHPSALETAYARLFEHIRATADYLIDLHDYGIQAIPFVFRDPVLYRTQRDKAAAQKLQKIVGAMLDALGLTVINEYVTNDYLKMNLHRSVSGAVLNTARIPAVTVEIGGQQMVNPDHVRVVVSGIRNMMRWAGMLSGAREPLTGVPVIDLGYPVRRTTHPRVPQACIVQHLVQPGDRVSAGDPLVRMVDIFGRPVGSDNGLLRSSHDGFVIGLFPGIAFYPNDAILGLAIRDKSDLVIQIP